MTVGRFRCPADHALFGESPPASSHFFVFPREHVWIRHDASNEPFLADANTVTYYNRGQRCSRRRASRRGDRADWFAVAPAALCDVLAGVEPAARDREDVPFAFSRGPSDALSYWRQRQVWLHVSRKATPDPLFVEETILSVLGRVTRLAYAARGRTAVTASPSPLTKAMIDASESARDVLASHLEQRVTLAAVAASVGVSMFHLARAFKARTGFTLHGYRTSLRLRRALEHLTDTRHDISQIALDLGFSSHSHFTAAFRSAFNATPHQWRHAGRPGL